MGEIFPTEWIFKNVGKILGANGRRTVILQSCGHFILGQKGQSGRRAFFLMSCGQIIPYQESISDRTSQFPESNGHFYLIRRAISLQQLSCFDRTSSYLTPCGQIPVSKANKSDRK